jgi:hypothetical protein
MQVPKCKAKITYQKGGNNHENLLSNRSRQNVP